jgi:hypothetical protein
MLQQRDNRTARPPGRGTAVSPGASGDGSPGETVLVAESCDEHRGQILRGKCATHPSPCVSNYLLSYRGPVSP